MKLISTIFLSGIAACCLSQETDRNGMNNRKQYMPSITRSIGMSFQSFDGLNERVAYLPQYEKLKDHAFTLGLGWNKEINRVVSDAGFTIGSSLSKKKDERSSAIRYLGFNANIGYDLVNSNMISLYPLVGLGAQAYQAIFNRDVRNVDFDDMLESPAVRNNIEPVRLNNMFFVYRAGIAVSFKSMKHPGHAIGLQAGYTGSFKKNPWRTRSGQLLGNAPEDRVSQFYVSLILSNRPWTRK